MDNLDITGRNYDRLQVLEQREEHLTDRERLRAAVKPLLAWYGSHARVLPWREDPRPYRVWISEIMLQQTRVEAVKPYYERFLAALPDVSSLAAVSDEKLMKLWEGLGYYNRARNLKKTAQILTEQYGGKLPSEYGELLKLPGIGSYTAGAIASIAYGKAVPAVDGNVLRVVSRVLASGDDILKQSTKRRMEELLREIMPEQSASGFNQGLIEIGAVVCVPNGAPHCADCPFSSVCLARLGGRIREFPVKKPPKKRRIEELTVCVLKSGSAVALHRRPPEGLLASLYELPNVPGHLPPEKLAEAFDLEPSEILRVRKLPDARHIFSHVEWHMTGYEVLLGGPIRQPWIAAGRREAEEVYALPGAFDGYRRFLFETGGV